MNKAVLLSMQSGQWPKWSPIVMLLLLLALLLSACVEGAPSSGVSSDGAAAPTATPAEAVTPAPPATNTPAPGPTATPSPAGMSPPPLAPTITDAKGAPMVLVPAGPFIMGSETGNDDEKPAHTVILAAYYIDQYEVTNARYQACVDAGACSPPAKTASATRASYYGNPSYDDYPVVDVDWTQAKTYCAWRGGRLPTEAEWEKAARGEGEQTYPWGDDVATHSLANYSEYEGDTTPVGHYPAGVSPYGAYDMAGNVWEWVQSEYKAYPYQVDDGREDVDAARRRVLRGGGWNFGESSARTTHRVDFPESFRYNTLGFRCVWLPEAR